MILIEATILFETIYKRFAAVSAYPFIFIRYKNKNVFVNYLMQKGYKEADAIKQYDRLITHELIHHEQQKELLLIFFPLFYYSEFFYNLLKYRNFYRAYRNISFEREVYEGSKVYNYLKIREKFSWINYR